MEGTLTHERNDFSELRAQVKGRVSIPGETGFDEDKASWNLVIGHAPDVVVAVNDEADVQAAVRYASQRGMPIAVQSTGHGQFKTSQGGMLIRTSNLKNVSVDVTARTATIGAGAMWAEANAAIVPHGLAPLSGSSPTVGVVGYLLGGGFSLLVRKHGLAIDHVRRIRLVLPDGNAVDATATANEDLFWALRGGGGSFGVITEVEVALFDHAQVFGGSLMYPAERAPEIYRAFANWTADLTEEVSAAILLITFPPLPFVPDFLQGRSMVIVCACMANVPDAETWIAPMRGLEPEFDSMGPLPYTESGRIYNEPENPMPAFSHGILLSELNEDTAKAFVEAVGEPSQSPNLLIQIRHIGGAGARVDESSAAVGDLRKAKYLLHFLGVPLPHIEHQAIVSNAKGVIEALRPWTFGAGPLNFVGEANVGSAQLKEVFGESNHARLVAIKRKYDPKNLFRHAGVGIGLDA